MNILYYKREREGKILQIWVKIEEECKLIPYTCEMKYYGEGIDNLTLIDMETIVKVKCISKKESQNYDPINKIATAIELEVPYDQNSIYWKMSGGTNLTLNTVNKAAADMFIIGESYDIIISPSDKVQAGGRN